MSSSLLLSIIYTVVHVIVVMGYNTFITGVPLNLVDMDALIKPFINGV